jgi:hypothetical protein
MRVADRNESRGRSAEAAGHIRSAMNCYLRAADYYRQAEFHLKPDDPRRLPTFTKMESCSHRFLALLNPPGEVLEIPYEGKKLYAYFVRAPFAGDRLPCLICMGGLDSIKDEMWFMPTALQRGISLDDRRPPPGRHATASPTGSTTSADRCRLTIWPSVRRR